MIVVLMGVAGCGKTAVGRRLAGELGWRFVDADDLHPPENIEKMRAGVPLDDSDREPWLRALRAAFRDDDDLVLACSALRRGFRATLSEGRREIVFAYLKCDAATAAERLRARENHFFGPALAESQYAALEEPDDAVVVDAERDIATIVDEIRTAVTRMRASG